MNSSRSLIIFLLIVLIAAVFWGAIRYFDFLREEQSPVFSSPSSPRENQMSVTIRITAQGFEPRTTEILKGETVEFINEDARPHWPASDIHPFHTQCQGFDALRGLAQGERYKHTFSKSQTCSFHDHLNPSLSGVITIK